MSLIKKNRLHLSLTPVCRLALLLAALYGTATSNQALASDITIGSPVNGTRIPSPVLIRAHNLGCDGLIPTSFGYSIDDSRGIVLGETPHDIDVTNDPIPAGTHAVHFKSWTARGACPTISTTFTVIGDAPLPSGIPPNAISSGDLDVSNIWREGHDGGTPGKSIGSTLYPAKTPLYDDARKFYMAYSAKAGERWSTKIATDSDSTHFVLDTYVYLPVPSEVLNLEMDVNQVTANGETVILSTQCSGVTGTWEYGYTLGRLDHWWSTKLKCNPKNWAANVWHHVQIGMHHDTHGSVTHDWVILDGVYSAFEDATRESEQSLAWGPGAVNTQFQIEGASAVSGTVTAYIHKLTVYRW